ncbi:sensor histidine kinase [Brevundimonas nasdae]|uniref:sensor histidine kinase n=1 Tax=Brevundimonas nasdae TaxID=172043 RepID=UPI002898F4E0|nr:HAMP domain-containing sensor histidine kinase [Brevundimonas nasdae]
MNKPRQHQQRNASRARPDADAALGPSLVALWHAGWAVSVALTALAAQIMGAIHEPALSALLVMALPGVAGIVLMAQDGAGLRFLLIGAWLLASLAAAGLTGGLAGPLPGLLVMPLAAGIALEHSGAGDDRLTRVGALAVGLALAAGLIAVWLNGVGAPQPVLAAASGFLALIATVTAMRLTWGERRRRLQRAENGLSHVENLLNAQPGLVMLLSAQGRLEASWGAGSPALPLAEVRTHGLSAIVNAPDQAAVAAALSRAETGQTVEVQFSPRAALDRRITLILRRFDIAGDAPRLIAQAFDGTAQFARELRLENARLEAEAQSAGKTRFLANMSHELRTPLNAVIGFADIMRQRLFGALPDRYAGYADSIHEAGGHLLALINDVLDLSKIEAERYELAVETFDARDAISAAIALVRLQADDRDIHLAGVLPPQPLAVTADPRALKQITLNLLSNAVKFTPKGGSVTVTLDAIGPYMELAVADTGVGIAPEDLKRLGRPFEQAGGSDQRSQGTGLGLSLVRSLTELHGGRMTIDSTLGEGTVIMVRLPVVAFASRVEPTAPVAKPAPVEA